MKSKIILCSGGARSGKSEFAERLAHSLTGKKAYIATGLAYDDEMKDRIQKHKERRGPDWENFEIPLYLHQNWPLISNSADIFLIDCLTMFATNHMMEYGEIRGQDDANKLEHLMLAEIQAFIKDIQDTANKTAIFVTNEIGLGIVPDNKMARYFRDIAGRINRAVADVSDEMYLTVSGVTIELKSREAHING